MVLDPIPQSLPVHFFGSRPQPPTSQRDLDECNPRTEEIGLHSKLKIDSINCSVTQNSKDLPGNRVDLEIEIFEVYLLRERILQHTHDDCNTLQRRDLDDCNILQHTLDDCNMPQRRGHLRDDLIERGVAVCCSVLQCVAVCCSVLQCDAV